MPEPPPSPNFRDAGETINTLAESKLLKERVLFRGGEIDFIEELQEIFSPRPIINLRKGTDPEFQGATTFHCPAHDSVDVYSVEAGYNRKWIISVLHILTDESAQPLFYIHCAAGKDRAGVIIGAVLMAIGIDQKFISQDYELSLGTLQPELFTGSLDQFEQPNYFRKVDIASLRERFI